MTTTVALVELDGEVLMPIPDELIATLGLSAGMTLDVTATEGRMLIAPLVGASNTNTQPPFGDDN